MDHRRPKLLVADFPTVSFLFHRLTLRFELNPGLLLADPYSRILHKICEAPFPQRRARLFGPRLASDAELLSAKRANKSVATVDATNKREQKKQFGKLSETEHSLRERSRQPRKLNDDRHDPNHNKTNTTTLAQCSLSASGVS